MSEENRGTLKDRLKRIFEKFGEDPRELISAGLEAGFSGEYKDAIEAFDRVLYTTFSKDKELRIQALYYKGTAFLNMGKYEESVSVLEDALKIEQKDASIWNDKGVVLLTLGRYEEALNNFREALKLDPDDSVILSNIGETLGDSGKHKEALEMFELALKIDPKDPDIWFGKGLALSELGDGKNALVAFDEALKLDPEHVDALVNKGIVFMDTGNNTEALACYQNALVIDSAHDLAWYNKACVFSLMKLTDDALDALVVATSLAPEYLLDLENDKDFDNIRETEKFKKLLRLVH